MPTSTIPTTAEQISATRLLASCPGDDKLTVIAREVIANYDQIKRMTAAQNLAYSRGEEFSVESFLAQDKA